MAANPERERDDDQFDPSRHKVWRVEVTRSYETHVVAETRQSAERIAKRHGPDEVGSAYEDYEASELTTPLTDDGELWGPTRRGSRDLTVNQALALIADPTTTLPPLIPALAPQVAVDWLRMAVGTDRERSVLCGIYVGAGASVATDGNRLHVVEREVLAQGLWGENGAMDADRFPNYRAVIPTAPAQVELVDLPAIWEVLAAAAEEREPKVTLPLGRSYIALSPRYLAGALVGAVTEGGSSRVLVAMTDLLSPVRFDFPEVQRTAVIMPIRRPNSEITSPGKYDLSRLLKPLGSAVNSEGRSR